MQSAHHAWKERCVYFISSGRASFKHSFCQRFFTRHFYQPKSLLQHQINSNQNLTFSATQSDDKYENEPCKQLTKKRHYEMNIKQYVDCTRTARIFFRIMDNICYHAFMDGYEFRKNLIKFHKFLNHHSFVSIYYYFILLFNWLNFANPINFCHFIGTVLFF